MKVYINAYLEKNLGDDLFVKILTQRYLEHQFYSISRGQKGYSKDNLVVYSNKYLFRIIKKFQLEKFLANRCDLVVSIGGSMYMENNDSNRNFSLGKNKYYILGSNFGPYTTEKYFNNLYNFFSKAEDICFREAFSYELFKNLPNVRYAADVVFNLNTQNIKNTNRKRVIISIISCEEKIDKKYTKDYEQKIIEMMEIWNQNDYEICLMSFCESENDEKAIESILNKCDKKLKEKIETYYYKGDVDEALNIIGDSQIVVGSRFHANIIGLLLEKKIIPILYSDKTKHVLEDMNIKTRGIDIRKMKNYDIAKEVQDNIIENYDISEIKENAKKQFEKLDNILGRKNDE